MFSMRGRQGIFLQEQIINLDIHLIRAFWKEVYDTFS